MPPVAITELRAALAKPAVARIGVTPRPIAKPGWVIEMVKVIVPVTGVGSVPSVAVIVTLVDPNTVVAAVEMIPVLGSRLTPVGSGVPALTAKV